MKFNYQARTKEGALQSGTVEASTREAALALLEKYGLYVTSLEKAEAVPIFFRKVKLFQRIPQSEVISFSRQLAIMFQSRIPIVEIFYTLAKQTRNELLKEKIIKIAEDVEGGVTLSAALAKHPKIFNSFYVSMVRSGEISGELSEVLNYLADHLEREGEFRSKVTGAMIYPAMVLLVVVVVIAVMALFVIPKLGEMIKETGVQVPWMTRLVLGFSDFLRKRALYTILVIGVLVFAFLRYLKGESGKKTIDRVSLKIPILSGFLQKLYLNRFAENLATLISGGLPIARALEITADVVGNSVYKNVILETKEGVRRGEPISSVLEKYPEVVPPLFTQMTAVGEKAGQVSPSLMNIAGFYKRDVERTLDNFVSFLEPLLIIFLGGAVAILVGAVLMPIYQVSMSAF
jgi:type IV pilus assembly protein PilC